MAESRAKHTTENNAGGLRWLGTHAIIGVPARDLTPAEAARHAGVIAASEQAHGHALYAPVAAPRAAEASHSGAAAPSQKE